MINIKIPSLRIDEHTWVINQVFKKFLKLDYLLEIHDLSYVEVNINQSRLITPSIFLTQNNNHWLNSDSLTPNISYLILSEYFNNSMLKDIPILFGHNSVSFTNYCHLNFDLFGSIFYILSNYSDVISHNLDTHSRPLGKDSFLFKNNIHLRPVVDEYCYLISLLIAKYDPTYSPSYNNGNVRVTCDVDQPLDRATSFSLLLRSMLADIILRKNFLLLIKRILNFFLRRIGIYYFDPNNTFLPYLNICRKYGILPEFYFISTCTNPTFDGKYSLHEVQVSKIISMIANSNCTIGLHGSYDSYNDIGVMKLGINTLKKSLEKFKISTIVNRQHYLRWDPLITPFLLDQCGIIRDTSGAYADIPGFKYGTSKDFNMWCFYSNKSLRLVQTPLIFMECTIIMRKYLGLGYTKNAYNLVKNLKDQCIFYNGNFVVLWHNSFLTSRRDWSFFEYSIKK